MKESEVSIGSKVSYNGETYIIILFTLIHDEVLLCKLSDSSIEINIPLSNCQKYIKRFIITQEELDTLEAIRLKLYDMFAACGNVSDIIKVGAVSEPLWKIINTNRKEL